MNDAEACIVRIFCTQRARLLYSTVAHSEKHWLTAKGRGKKEKRNDDLICQ